MHYPDVVLVVVELGVRLVTDSRAFQYHAPSQDILEVRVVVCALQDTVEQFCTIVLLEWCRDAVNVAMALGALAAGNHAVQCHAHQQDMSAAAVIVCVLQDIVAQFCTIVTAARCLVVLFAILVRGAHLVMDNPAIQSLAHQRDIQEVQATVYALQDIVVR